MGGAALPPLQGEVGAVPHIAMDSGAEAFQAGVEIDARGEVVITDLAASRCRLLILDRLVEEGPGRGRTLEEELDCSPSTVRRNLKILQDDGWVERRDGLNAVPHGRRFMLLPLLKAVRLFETYEEQEGFWGGHDVTGLPEELLGDLDMLGRGEVLRGDTADPLKPLRVAGEHVLGSSGVKILSPTFLEHYVEVYRETHERGIEVELVLTREGARQVDEMPEVLEVWREKRARGDLDISQVEEIGPMLFVGDDFVALSLPRTGEEAVDLSTVLLAEGRDAVEWGKRLFRHYREGAEPVEGLTG